MQPQMSLNSSIAPEQGNQEAMFFKEKPTTRLAGDGEGGVGRTPSFQEQKQNGWVRDVTAGV